MRSILDRFFDAIAAVDPKRIAECFAENGEIEDPVGAEVVRGRASIEASFRDGLAKLISSAEIDVIAAMPAGRSIAAHWRMRARGMDGREARAEGIDVIHTNETGEITRVEGYWDPRDFLRQLGAGS